MYVYVYVCVCDLKDGLSHTFIWISFTSDANDVAPVQRTYTQAFTETQQNDTTSTHTRTHICVHVCTLPFDTGNGQ